MSERDGKRKGETGTQRESLSRSLCVSLSVSENFQDLAAHLSVLCLPSPISFGNLGGSRVTHVVLTTSSTHSAISVESLSRCAVNALSPSPISSICLGFFSTFISFFSLLLYSFYVLPFKWNVRKNWRSVEKVSSICISGGEKETLVFFVTTYIEEKLFYILF